MVSRLLLNFHRVALPRPTFVTTGLPSTGPDSDLPTDAETFTQTRTAMLTSHFDIYDPPLSIKDGMSEAEDTRVDPVDLDGHGGGGGVRVHDIEMVPITYRT